MWCVGVECVQSPPAPRRGDFSVLFGYYFLSVILFRFSLFRFFNLLLLNKFWLFSRFRLLRRFLLFYGLNNLYWSLCKSPFGGFWGLLS